MDFARRTVLKSLAALPAIASMPTMAVSAGGGPINLVGFGGCGERLVRLLAKQHRSVIEGDYVRLYDSDTYPALPHGETLSTALRPNHSRPLVLVTAVGGRAGGQQARQMGLAYSDVWRSTEVRAVVVVPFAWEGTRRGRGLALAERFIRDFGRVTLIDNQFFEEQFLTNEDEIRLIDLYHQINAHAAGRIARVVARARNG